MLFTHMSNLAALAFLSPQAITARPLRARPDEFLTPHCPAGILEDDFPSDEFPSDLPDTPGRARRTFSHSFPSECPQHVDWSHGVGIDWDGVMQMQIFYVDGENNNGYEQRMTYETQTGPCNVPASSWNLAKNWYGQNTLDINNKANSLPEGKLLSSGIVAYMEWMHGCARQAGHKQTKVVIQTSGHARIEAAQVWAQTWNEQKNSRLSHNYRSPLTLGAGAKNDDRECAGAAGTEHVDICLLFWNKNDAAVTSENWFRKDAGKANSLRHYNLPGIVDDSPSEWNRILTGMNHFAKDGWGLEFGFHFVPCAGVIRALDFTRGRDHVQDQILENIALGAEWFPEVCGEGAKFKGGDSLFPGEQCYDSLFDPL